MTDADPCQEMDDRQSCGSDQGFIVAIGASAGGLQALTTFFQALPSDTAATFLVVQHLSPDVPSLLPEILQQQTQLPVRIMADGLVPQSRQVWVLPAGFRATLAESRLQLQARPATGADYLIDHLLISLARSDHGQIIGILLSGTGNDGTQGLRAIRRAGGITLAQAPETAEFGTMVEHAIAAGVVDQVLAPEDLATMVHDLVMYSSGSLPSGQEPSQIIPPAQLNQILTLIQAQEQLDFSQYKPGTLNRRILHRLVLSNATDLSSYIQQLRTKPEEVKRLGQELLIGSTCFFRDPDLWAFLARVGLPQMLDNLPTGQTLRMWVTACATGEEAYTLAMVINDVMVGLNQIRPIKIFATDIDVGALAIASRGTYSDSIADQLTPAQLERYFTRENHSFTVRPCLRNQIVFAPHDLTHNAGFSQMQLVFCRNVLIYMQPALQQQVLRLLHFSLMPQGWLVLGGSEGLGDLNPAFDEVDSHLKIFQKYADVPLRLSRPPRSASTRLLPALPSARPSISHADQFLAAVLRLGFDDHQVTCVLLNGRNQLVHVFLNTAQLLAFPQTEANLTLTDMVPLPLRLPLSSALHRIRRDPQPIAYANIGLGDNTSAILRVAQIEARLAIADGVLVWIERFSPDSPRTPADRPSATSSPAPAGDFEVGLETIQHIAALEAELQQTCEQLQATVEELDTTNQEYQATHEELLASNEELQSTNEELQSLNQELYTLNAENQTRIDQLTELNADITNLLSSTTIGVVFLDQDLNIRRFTPTAAQIFSLRPTDIERPLTDLNHALDLTDLAQLLRQVATTHHPIDREVIHAPTQVTYLMRVLPYRQEDGRSSGVVLTLVNISELKQVQRQLQQSNELLENIYAASPTGLCLLDAEQRYLMVNDTLATMNGVPVSAHIGQRPDQVLPGLADRFQALIQRVLDHGEALYNIEMTGTAPTTDTVPKTWLASYYPVSLLDGAVGVGITVNDITELKQVQADLDEQRTFAQQVAESTPDIISIFELPSGTVAYINRAMERLLGYGADDICAAGEERIAGLLHPDDLPSVQAHLAQLETAVDGAVYSYAFRVRHQNGSWRWFEQRNTVFRRNAAGQPVQILGISTDITERLEIQQALERSETLFRKTLEGSQVVVFTQDIHLRYTWIQNPAGDLPSDQMIGKTDPELLPDTPETQQLIEIKRRVLVTEQAQRQELALPLGNAQSLQYYDATFSPLYDSVGNLTGLMAVVVDITDRKQAELALETARQQLEDAQQVARIGSWRHHLSGPDDQWSAEIWRIFDLNPDTDPPVVETWCGLMIPEDRSRFQQAYAAALATGTGFNLDLQLYPANPSQIRYVNIIGKAKSDPAGRVTELFGTVLDITERKQTEAALHQQAFYDPLTQLPNRALFLEQLKQAIRQIRRPGEPDFAVMFLDVDAFKEVNDNLGHLAGDALLMEVSRRLQICIRPGDVVARLGGDEFAILLASANQSTAMMVAQRIQQTMARPFDLLGQRVDITVSIGIALCQSDLADQSDTALLENADIAMYRAKKRGPGQIEVFVPMMRSQDTARVALRTALKQALERQELVLYYQPIVTLATLQLHGFEALLRWDHPDGELLSPGAFMEVLRTSHFMYEVETWVLRQACQQLQQWMQLPHPHQPDLTMSINLSPDSLTTPGLVQSIRQILVDTQVQPQRVVLEITEHSFLNPSRSTLQTLTQLQDLGLRFALDDFGTGYSSLSFLHQLPITTVKIDRTFVQCLDSDPNLMRITSGISALSQALNLRLVAEGVETLPQLVFLRQQGCHYGQGYLFARPLSVTDATSRLQHPMFEV